MGVQSGGVSPGSGLATSGIVLTVLIVLIGLVFGAHASGTDQTFLQGILGFISKLVLYMPNVLFGYGFMADIFNNTGYHYSIASTTALLGMVINKTLGTPIATGLSFIGETVKQAPIAAAAIAAAATAVVAPAVVAAAPAVATGIEMTTIPSAVAPAAAAAAIGTAAASNLPEGTPPSMSGGSFTCSLPGFEWLENTLAPQGIIMSMTVLWYLMIELWDTGSSGQTVALGVTTAITFIIQWLVLSRNGCLNSYRFAGYSPLIALVMAITFAGSSYGIQKIIQKNMSSGGIPVAPVPSGTPGTFVCPPGTVLATNGEQCVTPLGPGGTQSIINIGGKNEKSQPVDDNDQFVCEAYKDGELVTSTIVD